MHDLGTKYLRVQTEVLQGSDQGFQPGQAWLPSCSEGVQSALRQPQEARPTDLLQVIYLVTTTGEARPRAGDCLV